MIMLKNKTVEFISKIWEFANKAKGRAGQKMMNLMMNREHTNFKFLTKKDTKKAKAKELEWPDVDPKKARELKKYIETATFGEIMESTHHKRNTDEMTYQTTSNKLCYWCHE